MAWTADLLRGLAQLLEDAGVGTYAPTGVYTDGDPTPIFTGASPASPDRTVVLAAYDVANDSAYADSTVGVQVRTRGRKGQGGATDVGELDDAIYDALQGLHSLTLSTGVRINKITRNSSTPMGVDSNQRHERASNYYVTAYRPAPHRT